MTTICNISIPARDFGLEETLEAVPDARVAGEPVAASGRTGSLPLIRAQAPDCQQLAAALTSDRSVAEWTRLTDGGSGWLYRIEWAPTVALVHRLLTGERATVLSATGNGREWSLRVLYPSREACSQLRTLYDEHGLNVTVMSIRTADSEPSMRHGLTEAQHTALLRGYEMGYFSVPREAGLETVAKTLDISHQALSERLRRAHQTLIETTLCRSWPKPRISSRLRDKPQLHTD